MATRRKYRPRGLSGTPAHHREKAMKAAEAAKSAFLEVDELAYDDKCSNALESLAYAEGRTAVAHYDFIQGKSKNLKLMGEVRDAQDKAVRQFSKHCMIKSKI